MVGAREIAGRSAAHQRNIAPGDAEAVRSPGLLLVLSGPSGVGKTTLARHLLARPGGLPAPIVRSVSVTTRAKRLGEVDATDYRFVSEAHFAEMIAHGELLEHAEVFGHRYGTPRAFVEAHLAAGTDVLLVLDGQGRRQVAAHCPAATVSLFLLPPSLRELERRLRNRAEDSAECVDRRLNAAGAEIGWAQEYDYVLVNHDPARTLADIDVIRHAEHRRRHSADQPVALRA